MTPEARARLQEEMERRGLLAPAEASLGERAWGVLNQLQPVEEMAQLVSGSNAREFDYPELPVTAGLEHNPMSPYALQGTMGLARDDIGKLGIFANAFPEDAAGAGIDAYGNVFVEHNGQNYYLDRPGLSPQDAADIGMTGLAEGLAMFPAARLGQAVGGVGGRAVGTGIGGVVGSIGQDLMASTAGSTAGVDPEAAFVAGVFGFGGEAGIALGSQVARWLRRLVGDSRMYVPGQGLTPAGEEAFQRLGIDPSKMSDDIAQTLTANPADRWGADAAEMASPETALPPGGEVAIGRAQGLPEPVQLSRGDVTVRNPAVQGREELYAAGAMGDPAANVMRNFREGQTNALNSNLDIMQTRLGGGVVDRAAPGGGMDIMQQRLLRDIDQSNRGINQAYTAARDAGADAALTPEGVSALGNDFADIIQENAYDIAQMPRTTSRLQDFQRIVDDGQMGPGSPEGLAGSVNEMERWRQRITRDIIDLRGVEGAATERRALIQMVRRYDEFMGEALDNALVEGNEQAIQLWRDAVGLRRAHYQRYEEDDLIRRITEQTPTVDEAGSRIMAPAMTPQQSVNLLFGVNSLATSRFSNSASALRRLKTMYGAESPEWNALREEAFVRLAPARGNINDPNPAFTAFVRNYDNTMRDAPELMSILFNPIERRAMQDLRDTIELVTTRPPGVVNRSGSGNAVLRAAGQFFSNNAIGSALKAGMDKAFGWLVAGTRANQARGFINYPMAPPPPAIPGLGGYGAATGAVGSGEPEEAFRGLVQ